MGTGEYIGDSLVNRRIDTRVLILPLIAALALVTSWVASDTQVANTREAREADAGDVAARRAPGPRGAADRMPTLSPPVTRPELTQDNDPNDATPHRAHPVLIAALRAVELPSSVPRVAPRVTSVLRVAPKQSPPSPPRA